MNFRPELAEAVVTGHKWVTRRLVSDNPRSPYHPERAYRMEGKTIAICPGRGKSAIGKVRVHSVHRESFFPGLVNETVALSEGFPHPAAFRDTWKKLNGNLNPVDVWRIELRDPVPSSGSGE